MKKDLFILTLAFAALSGWAKTGLPEHIHLVDGIYYQYLDDGAWVCRSAHYGYEDEIIADDDCYFGDVVIPEEVDGRKVVGILSNAFLNSAGLTSITLPATVGMIAGHAFQGCSSLTEFTIPVSVDSIGEGVFTNCTGIRKFVIADGNHYLKVHGNGQMGEMKSLEELYVGRASNAWWWQSKGYIKKLTLTGSVTEVKDGEFNGGGELETVTLGNQIVRIGENAFQNCSKFSAISISEGVCEIGYYAFYGCRRLPCITLPSTLKLIGGGAFIDCKALEEITIPASVDSIGGYVFSRCDALKRLTFEDGPNLLKWEGCGDVAALEEIFVGREYHKSSENFAFNIGSSLKKITFNDRVKRLYYSDLWFNGALETIILGKGFTQIDDGVFTGTGAVKEIYCYAAVPPVLASLGNINPNTCTLYVPAASIDAYKEADNWKKFFNISPIGEPTLTCPDSRHPHLIDLGLPSGTRWACCNIGAKAPEEHGDHFQWGETEPEQDYTGDSYLYYSQNIGNDIQGTDYDVAHVKWQSGWLMPNRAQVDEMVANCTFEDTTLNEIPGRMYTGANGNRIFLPYTGWARGGAIHELEIGGVYWTSEVYDDRDAVYFLTSSMRHPASLHPQF